MVPILWCLRGSLETKETLLRKIAQAQRRSDFERIALDILDPLPRSSNGKYILVVMHYQVAWCISHSWPRSYYYSRGSNGAMGVKIRHPFAQRRQLWTISGGGPERQLPLYICVCVYIHTYIYIYTYIYIHTHAYIYICMWVCMHVYTCVINLYVCTYMYIHAYINIYIYICVCICVYI